MVRPVKRLGQHFLRDQRVIEATVAALGLTPEDTVIEIGPGEGVLTTALAQHAGKVVAIELDQRLADQLPYTTPRNVEVWHRDALDVAETELPPFRLIAGNLPYQISSPLTFLVLDWSWDRAVFLYQLEFAQRLVAEDPNDPHYGRLSVTRAYRAKARILRRVSKGAFHPPPKVASALVLLEPHETPPFDIGGTTPSHVAWFDRIVRECFSQRRKTLRKTLLNQAEALGLAPATGADVETWLEEAGLTERRVDELTPAEYGRLAATLLPYRNSDTEPAAATRRRKARGTGEGRDEPSGEE